MVTDYFLDDYLNSDIADLTISKHQGQLKDTKISLFLIQVLTTMNRFDKLSLVIAALVHLRIYCVLSDVKKLCKQSHEFRCDDGDCIGLHRVCNLRNDCKDGSDEARCSHYYGHLCPFGHFSCGKEFTCYPRAYICDGEDDCGDNSDERHCDYSTTSTTKIPVTTTTIPVETTTIPVATTAIPVTTTTIPVSTTVIHTATRKLSCPDNYCMHGADCIVIEGEYVCICSPSFTGENCESRISAEWKFHDLGIVIGISVASIILLIIGSLLIFCYFKRKSNGNSTAWMRKTESQMPIASYSKV